MTSFRRIGLALAAVAALMMPLAASAAPANNQASFQGGSLSISQPADGTFGANIPIAQGSVTANINGASYADATATGNGWNGTIATTKFHMVPAWTPGGTAAALADNSSNPYLGTATADHYTLSVTASSAAASTTVAYSYTGAETGTGSAIKGTPSNVGTMALSITFTSGVAYASTDTYSTKVGNMPAAALALSGTTTIAGGANPPVAVGGTSTVTAGNYLTMGSPLKFVSASVGSGVGAFTVTPGVTLTWVPASTWAATYVASANYAIVSGP